MLKVKEVGNHQTEEAPFVSQEPQTRVIEVEGSKVSSPYHFLSYPTIKKFGGAMTVIGAAFICISGLTIVDIFGVEIYVFYLPGLAVILAGSFGISASKVKWRKLKKGLVIVTVILSICAIIGALYSLVTAVQIMIRTYAGKIDILFVLRIGVAVVVIVIAGMMLAIALDSLLCGRHRPGYSTVVRLVCKAEDIEMDQLDGVNYNMHSGSHDHSRHNGHQRNHLGNGSPRPHHHGNHSPRPHGNKSPRHHGNHSPRPHGDRSPRHHSPHHHGDQLTPLNGYNDGHGDQKHCNQLGGHPKDKQHHHHHHHHHRHHRHQREYITTEKTYSGLERMASLDHSTDHKAVNEHHDSGWDVVNKM
ncbi:uncharacterized protein LOC135489194 [Lineus longissimus]|uniref:uncharacterized protein LOC135489194 n=1 Tax=Lineus longissimus TaxID=88925 RepID=UPI002B4D4550